MEEIHGNEDMDADVLRRILIPERCNFFSDREPMQDNQVLRERLCREGRESLSDSELLSVILNLGTKGKSALKIACDLLEKIDSLKVVPDVEYLCKINGLGTTKACVIVAMMEFCRRRWGMRRTRIKYPKDIFSVIRHFADYPQERFITLSLSGAHEVIATRIVTIGLVNKTIVHPREVFSDVIRDRASALCVAHNHPSGTMYPSAEDDEVTKRLYDDAQLLGISFLDHLIFTQDRYYSYREAGKMPA